MRLGLNCCSSRIIFSLSKRENDETSYLKKEEESSVLRSFLLLSVSMLDSCFDIVHPAMATFSAKGFQPTLLAVSMKAPLEARRNLFPLNCLSMWFPKSGCVWSELTFTCLYLCMAVQPDHRSRRPSISVRPSPSPVWWMNPDTSRHKVNSIPRHCSSILVPMVNLMILFFFVPCSLWINEWMNGQSRRAGRPCSWFIHYPTSTLSHTQTIPN